MNITRFETFIVSVPYRHCEVSSRIQRDGVTAVLVKLTTDCGLVGWGECSVGADAASIQHAARSCAPFLMGQDPWQLDAIAQAYFQTGLWDHRPMTGNFAFAGIDQALWDLCGKQCGQPLYRLLGGAVRERVNYFCYLAQAEPDNLSDQCRQGLARGHDCFYLKVGVNRAAETRMLRAIRDTIGPEKRIRIDANQAWSVAEARSILTEWHAAFDIDFVEAPVRINPLENMLELRRSVPMAVCANEGLWTSDDAYRLLKSRCADVLCFSSYWVGTLRSFHTLCHAAHLEGLQVCKHTHGELGLAAAAGQHLLLNIPNACDGAQQTAAMIEDDILTERIPIADGATWAVIDAPGLGVSVDETKVKQYEKLYQEHGQFLPYAASRIEAERTKTRD
ncbi:MAG: mandelate racemase/muconate lactonizing enzyme family protein [Planctomycetaceae bacterium]